MGGYIVLTTQEWIDSLQKMDAHSAVFWRKRQSFKAVDVGEPIYFLRRGPFSSNEDRFLVGKGSYAGHQVMEAKLAWKQYEKKLGFTSESSFLSSVLRMYKSVDAVLGCILLQQLEFFSEPISLKSADVEFSPYTVSGRRISTEECTRIDNICGGAKWNTVN